MNHRERILAAIRHQPVDRCPTDFWATPEVQEKLFEHFGIRRQTRSDSWTGKGVIAGEAVSLMGNVLSRGGEGIIDLYDAVGIDGIINISPPYIGPALLADGNYSENEWGMGYRRWDHGEGSYNENVRYPLEDAQSIADLDAYRWPSPDWYDYSALPDIAALFPDRAIACGYVSMTYYAYQLRGLENSLMDPLLRPDFTRHMLRRMSDFFQEYHSRCFEAARGTVHVTQVTDDYGSQKGLLISPRTFDGFYREPVQRALDLARSFGIVTFHHDDGDCRGLLPTLTEMGIQVLNPLQWRCGDWDLVDLKTKFGDRICFHGGVDNQQTLPFGSREQVRAEVKRLIESLASDGTGYIIAPCHNIQPNTSVEKILELYRAAHDYGRYGCQAGPATP
jgi:uroporphyrinogen decarboxylase